MHIALKKVHSVEGADELYNTVVIKIREIESERKRYTHKALEKHFGENIFPFWRSI